MNQARPAAHVLVVDDNEDSAMMLADALALMGFRATVALDGFSAIERARHDRPDAALVDIGLPGMDGLEVARGLRRLPGLERLRLAALTGYGSDEDIARSREAGFDAHLVKPVELRSVRAFLLGSATHGLAEP